MKKADRDSLEKNRPVQQESVTELEKFRRPLLEYLTSSLEHEDKWVRYMAVDMLGALGDPQAIRHLMPLIVSEDQNLRAVALQSLETIEDFQITPVSWGSAECNGCLIRNIAEEAMAQLRNKSPCTSVT
jgi:HEAT repeat protein